MSEIQNETADVGGAGTEDIRGRGTNVGSGATMPNFDHMSQEDLLAFAEAALDHMNIEGLQAIAEGIRDRQQARQDERRIALLEKWRREAADAGMSFEALVSRGAMPSSGRRPRGDAGRTVAPKFRGPNGETWSGRGIPPKWLTALEATGRNRNEFRIT